MAIYRGIQGDILGIPLNELVGTSAVSITDLPASVQDQLEAGIRVQNEQAALDTINSYRDQIYEEQEKAAQLAQEVSSEEGAEAPDQTDSGQTDGGE